MRAGAIAAMAIAATMMTIRKLIRTPPKQVVTDSRFFTKVGLRMFFILNVAFQRTSAAFLTYRTADAARDRGARPFPDTSLFAQPACSAAHREDTIRSNSRESGTCSALGRHRILAPPSAKKCAYGVQGAFEMSELGELGPRPLGRHPNPGSARFG